MSVQRSQSTIQRGQQATYVVQVSTVNGSASGVSVTLASQPSSQKPTFTRGCAKGNGAATCTISSVLPTQTVNLNAQIPVAASATTVTSVTLTATADIVTTVKWTPPSAAETVTVTAASASASASPTKSRAGASPATTLPLGPIPDLNGVSSSLIGAGNAAGLFPAIFPSPTSSPSPGIHPVQGRRNANPVSESSALGLEKPVLTGQLAGLIALAVAVMLTVTRLSLRKRFGSRKQGS